MMGKLLHPIDWPARFAKWQDEAPFCVCGCGKKVKVNCEQAQRDRVKNYSHRPHLPGHNNRHSVPVLSLFPREEQVVLGTVLGDGYLGYAHSTAEACRLVCNHGIKQKPYSEWKARELARLGAEVHLVKNDGYGELSARMATRSHSALNPLREAFYYPDKVVGREVLDKLSPLALAVWFMDDGSVGRNANSSFFHTEGFDTQSVCEIVWWFNRNGIEADISQGRRGVGKSIVRLRKEPTRLLFGLIEPYIIPSMRYKLCLV
jgi:recombination protein RecA